MAPAASQVAWREPTKADKPPKEADLPTAWRFLQAGVEHIMTRLNLGMSYQYYILLYTTIYDFCTAPNRNTFSTRNAGANLQGADLYNRLATYLNDHCQSLREEGESLTDVELLKYYARHWDRYTQGAAYVNKLFNYLNKHWVKREKDEGRKDIYTVYNLALVAWKSAFLKYIQLSSKEPSRLTQALLKQIELQRNGESIDNGLLKKVIDSYVGLGWEGDTQKPSLDVYSQSFQHYFIEATRVYYTKESNDFLANNSVPDYMKKVDGRLQEELDRVSLYLNVSTEPPLVAVCETVLIQQHQQLLWNEFQLLLEGDREADLMRMYDLLRRVPNALEPLRKGFEEHVKKAGLDAVDRVMPAAGAVNENGKPEQLDPKTYVEALLDVHTKFSSFVHGPFHDELGFSGSLDRACNNFVNLNAAATTSTKSPDLLASYCDQLLRKSNKDLDPTSLENALSQAMIIFRFINDKDVFQKFYQKKLAQRLITGASASDDSESSMISKLKEQSGFDYTSKLTRMFSDVSVSRDVTERFQEKERQGGHADVDFSIMVLGTNFWPLAPQQTDFSVPRPIQGTYDRFIRSYNDMHSGRKLTWLWHVSKCELRPSYLSQKYIFMTNAYQMAILTLFNDNDSLTYQDMRTGTKIEDQFLKPQLNLLVRTKVLLQRDDTYDLNLNFKSKKIRVLLNMPVKADQKAENVEVLQAVDEDRKFVYQATIVRLMKARKTMKHQALIQDVTAAISVKFTPKVSEIKKAIDHLIDKEYLERGSEKDTYNYLA